MVAEEREYTYDEVLKFKRCKKVVTLQSDSWEDTVELEGVLVSELIGGTGVLPEAEGISFRASDGYEALFSLNHLSENQIILVYGINGESLTPEGGYPFILAAETVRGQDWVKWVTEIEVQAD
jgi:DMSO/TMAO reductase YedYZ molybdopterin-dependent catalytic subunit